MQRLVRPMVYQTERTSLTTLPALYKLNYKAREPVYTIEITGFLGQSSARAERCPKHKGTPLAELAEKTVAERRPLQVACRKKHKFMPQIAVERPTYFAQGAICGVNFARHATCSQDNKLLLARREPELFTPYSLRLLSHSLQLLVGLDTRYTTSHS